MKSLQWSGKALKALSGKDLKILNGSDSLQIKVRSIDG
jgi:hypothetical protein